MSLLVALRSGTRDAHDRLEDGLDVVRRCRTPEAYAVLLQDLRSLYAPLERALCASAATAPVVPDWALRRKTPWLDDDLLALGAPPAPDRPVPALVGGEDVAGACYVMEGATLGGALVVRALVGRGGAPPPHRFFTSYGADRGAMWAAFRRHLGAAALDEQRTVAAARRTFRCFEHACLEPARTASTAAGA